jgi:hypothetical protein
MGQRWWGVMGGLALLLVLVMGGAAACGGDDDKGKIKARAESFFNHVNKADAKGLINDLPPDIRKGCNEGDIKKAAEELKAFNFKMKEIKNTNVNGNNATADITVSSTIEGKTSDDTTPQKFLKVDDNWYIDNEGKTCADFIGSGP